MQPPPVAASSATLGDGMRAGAGDLLPVRIFVVSLAVILAGYMAMSRGFAHLGVGPIYLGEIVLAVGLVATAYAVVRLGLRPFRSVTVGLVVLFMAWGLIRTIPYISVYGLDALRDGVLWGYAFFALMIYLLADRAWIRGAVRAYGLVVPLFALWLPIAWTIWLEVSKGISTQTPAALIPLVYFKAGDVAAHVAGAVAFIVLLTGSFVTFRAFALRYLIAQSFVWAMFICGTVSRGALVASASGLAIALAATRRFTNWLPIVVATVVLMVALTAGPAVGPIITSVLPAATPAPSVPAPVATEAPPWWAGNRPVSLGGLIGNITSTITNEGDVNQEGTKRFRLEWWTAIVNYTVFGPYFWEGKGFGVNLADADGFQPTQDHSLRAPHNSSMTVLARMGVPGFVLWLGILAGWALGMLRAYVRSRRAGDGWLSAVSAWLFIYWFAMMVVTSFDPYIEGPQGGIWFWTIFGLGLVVMRLAPEPGAQAAVPLLGESGWRESLRTLVQRGERVPQPDLPVASPAVPRAS
jgi:hypothetical protein